MSKLQYNFLLCILTICTSLASLAQSDQTIWTPIQNHELISKRSPTQSNMPTNFWSFQLTGQAQLERILLSAPMRFSSEANESNLEVSLPMPNGQMESFRVYNFPVLESQLAAAYPALRSFSATCVRNPNMNAKIELTPHGFSAMIFGHDQGTIFINPHNVTDKTYYSFYKKDLPDELYAFDCKVFGSEQERDQITGDDANYRAGDCQLRQYRLALACTGEYAQLIDDGDDSNGNIIADVLADMVVTINRINGIFENEAGLTMVIIADNENIIFTDPDTDPYTNSSTSEMLGENISVCRNFIGSANFDIGHVLGFGGGGQAFLRSPCTGNKAQGVSKRRAGNYARFLSTLAHEMGHQYGANHTHGNDCFRVTLSSYEVGSGSTIMSYAGICPPYVESAPDLYYHANSLERMGNFVIDGGNSCATILSTANNAPIADAGSNYIIPVSTPFVLTGNAIDPDHDPITYCWEQWDREFTVQPPSPLSTEGPAIRSFPPTTDSVRYIPRLSDLRISNNSIWEVLPEVSRDLNFRLTVRDNNSGYGCTDESDMTVTTDASAGPFVITAPNSSMTWDVGTMEMITWDVANTDMAPINCADVDILYSTDGGLTFPNVLAANIPNNGATQITVPEVISSSVRFMVRCSDNIFFDISDADVVIGIRQTCLQINSTDIPIAIPSSGTPTITSELNVNIDETITDINVMNVVGTHSYVGDLRFTLISPTGTSCTLVNQRCALSQDFNVNFDDDSDILSCPYNDGQTVSPIEPLSVYNGVNAAGNWTLEVADLSSSDGGELVSWGLEICYETALVSVDELFNKNTSMELSPNPVRETLNVSILFDKAFNGQLQVMNTVGEIVNLVDVESDEAYQNQLQLAHLPAGVYFLKLTNQKGLQLVKRFIKL
jgi:subtilisin-like proprotein convertase family protein